MHLNGLKGSALPQLFNFQVNQQPIPKTLQEVEDEALLAIQESKSKEIAVTKIEEWPYVKRQAIPTSLKPENPLISIPKRRTHSLPTLRMAGAIQLFLGLAAREVVVLVDPEGDVFLLNILFDNVVSQCQRATRHIGTIVEFMLVKRHPAVPDDFQHMHRVIATMPDPLPLKNISAPNVEAIHVWRDSMREHLLHLML